MRFFLFFRFIVRGVLARDAELFLKAEGVGGEFIKKYPPRKNPPDGYFLVVKYEVLRKR